MGGKHQAGSPRDRVLGSMLRHERHQAKMSLREAAEGMKWDPSTLSRLENGQRHVSPEAVMGLAVLYYTDAPKRKEMVEWAKTPAASIWWEKPMPGMPVDAGALANFERVAEQLTEWSPATFPQLLQTPDYMQEILRDCDFPASEISSRIATRQIRQKQIFSNRPVGYTAFISSTSVSNSFGDRLVIADQLRFILQMSSRSSVSVRYIQEPVSLAANSWYLLDFKGTNSVVRIEHVASGSFINGDEVAAYKLARRKLEKMALDESRTREVLAGLLSTLS